MLNPYQQYKQTSVNTMTKGELLILLFDGLIKKLTLGKLMLENKNFDEARKNLDKSRNIINHLIFSLDPKIEISRELSNMYTFLNAEIIKAAGKNDASIIDAILPIVRDLRDTWAQADKIARTSKE